MQLEVLLLVPGPVAIFKSVLQHEGREETAVMATAGGTFHQSSSGPESCGSLEPGALGGTAYTWSQRLPECSTTDW